MENFRMQKKAESGFQNFGIRLMTHKRYRSWKNEVLEVLLDLERRHNMIPDGIKGDENKNKLKKQTRRLIRLIEERETNWAVSEHMQKMKENKNIF